MFGSLFCNTVLGVISRFAIISLRKRGLLALLLLCSYCHMALLRGAVGWSVVIM